ncbi:DUF4238 domain-containing protein [Flavobacterium sp. PS2]|uniref:DUF4238 domain-containing protein n=1 Tax=Flavobacterium sp. PS2 TaxID=3384157 RepID=UPI00390C8A9E
MNPPINHHFVSQVHIKNFFNNEQKKIYVYDKIEKRQYFKKTTKSLFSEPKLNSKFKKGEVDHYSIEKELNDYFEKDFSRNTQIIKKFVSNKEFTEGVNSALTYFAKYGIIGEMRTPRFKKETDNALEEIFANFHSRCTPELKTQIEEVFEYKKEVKYSNMVSFIEITEKIFQKMGRLIFEILIPESETDFFIVPDFSAGTARERINEYFNLDIKDIAFISLPLESKIYIRFYSEKLYKNPQVPNYIITYCSSELVKEINEINLDYCQDKIACENEEYLKSFISAN